MQSSRARARAPRWAAVLLGGSLILGLSAFAAKDEKGFVRIPPAEIQWTSPNGASAPQVAIIEGDPTKPGIYVQRTKFPPGIFSLPHYHREDRHVVVIQGTWYTGTGETFDPDRAVALGPGSYMKHPAGQTHWDGAKDEEVIVQIIGIGPSETKALRPEQGRYTSINARKP